MTEERHSTKDEIKVLKCDDKKKSNESIQNELTGKDKDHEVNGDPGPGEDLSTPFVDHPTLKSCPTRFDNDTLLEVSFTSSTLLSDWTKGANAQHTRRSSGTSREAH